MKTPLESKIDVVECPFKIKIRDKVEYPAPLKFQFHPTKHLCSSSQSLSSVTLHVCVGVIAIMRYRVMSQLCYNRIKGILFSISPATFFQPLYSHNMKRQKLCFILSVVGLTPENFNRLQALVMN